MWHIYLVHNFPANSLIRHEANPIAASQTSSAAGHHRIIAFELAGVTTRAQSSLGTYTLTNLTIIDANHIPGLQNHTALTSVELVIKAGRICQ